MGPLGRDPPLFEDDDPVRFEDRADPLGHDEGRAAFGPCRQRLLDPRFGLHVHGAGAVVEDQDHRPHQERPRDRDPLPLAAGEVRPPLLDAGVVPLREGRDECVRLGRPGRLDDLVVAGAGGTVPDVVPHRPGEEDRLLRDDGDPGEERLLGQAADIDPVDEDPSGGDVIEAGNEVHQRRLSGTRRPEEGHGLARLDGEVDPVQDVFGVRAAVVEGDVFKDDPPPRRLRQGDRVRGVPHIGLGIQDLVDPPGRGIPAGPDVREDRHHDERRHRGEEVVREGNDLPDGEFPLNGADPADPDDDHHPDVHAHRQGWRHARHDLQHLDRAAGELFIGRLEAFSLEIGPDEGLDEPGPGDVLLEDRVEPIEPLLDGAEEWLHPGNEQDDDDRGDGEDRQHRQCEASRWS